MASYGFSSRGIRVKYQLSTQNIKNRQVNDKNRTRKVHLPWSAMAEGNPAVNNVTTTTKSAF